MNVKLAFALHLSRALPVAAALTLALPVIAQDDMQGMDMPQVAGTQRHSHKHAVSQEKPETATPKQSTAPSTLAASAGPSTPDMDMSAVPKMTNPTTQPPRPVQMERLHAGQMIGVRPISRGLDSGNMQGMSSMQGMDVSSMQGGNAPSDARSPDYSDGYRYTLMPGMHMPDNAPYGMLLLDQFEYADGRHGNSTFIDGDAYYGTDFDKLWVKVEGERSSGKLQDLRAEALWDHAIATYWSTQLGVRHDFGEGPGHTWAAFGVQGLAPYWFETEATVYVGQSGHTAARFETEYDVLLTQRLILQPRLEVNLYGQDDSQRGIGSGLSDAEFGLRLRYEIRREFAPYIGVVLLQRFGHTADFMRSAGGHADETQIVAGVRVWF